MKTIRRIVVGHGTVRIGEIGWLLVPDFSVLRVLVMHSLLEPYTLRPPRLHPADMKPEPKSATHTNALGPPEPPAHQILHGKCPFVKEDAPVAREIVQYEFRRTRRGHQQTSSQHEQR